MENKAKKPYENVEINIGKFVVGDVLLASTFDNEGVDVLWETRF